MKVGAGALHVDEALIGARGGPDAGERDGEGGGASGTQVDKALAHGNAGGGIKFPLQVLPNSPIKNLDGLKGKSILTIVGSDLHLVLNLMLQAHFGTDDPKALGITVKNIQAFAELTRAAPGLDAVLSVEPAAQGAVNAGQWVNLLKNDGTTGPAYDGPEGKGEGHKIASAIEYEIEQALGEGNATAHVERAEGT